MLVLGISCFYHDSAAALIKDGVVVAAAAEERFCRRKHTAEFPKLAIEYCLKVAGATIETVDHIVFYEKPLVKFHRILVNHLATWPWSWFSWCKAIPSWITDKLHIGRIIQKQLNTEKDILFCEHHMSHAASAFLPSPFDDAIILTTDGVGEWGTVATGFGEGTNIVLESQISFPHSIGLFYSALTSYLGFRVNDAEWKVMGLAPYGRPAFVEPMRKMFDVKEDGSFRLDMSYFSHHFSTKRMYSDKWAEVLGLPPRQQEAEIDDAYTNIAHSGQKVVEEVLLKMAMGLKKRYNKNKIVIAGGVGLNSVANWKILKEGGFDDIFIQPAAGDDGAAIGAAMYVYHTVLKQPRVWQMHCYLGNEYTQEEIERDLKSAGAVFEVAETDEKAAKVAAEMVADSKVIGWFQGRMEFGPRALGNRSIVADPRDMETKTRINAKIKFREAFRPFAPSVLLEKAHEYFDMPPGYEAPYMLLIPQVKEDKKSVIPAVTHQDGSGRVQTVRRDQAPQWYALIENFEKLTGVPVVVNTSFNVRGEPIVRTPLEAYTCFCRTGIDALVIGRCIVTEKPSEVDFEAGMKNSIALESKPVYGTT